MLLQLLLFQDVHPRVSVTRQGNIAEDGLHIEYEVRDPEVWGESELAKMAHSGALTPCFVNNDYVTVEIIHSTAHARPEVLSWSWAGQHAPVSFTAKALAARALGLQRSGFVVASVSLRHG